MSWQHSPHRRGALLNLIAPTILSAPEPGMPISVSPGPESPVSVRRAPSTMESCGVTCPFGMGTPHTRSACCPAATPPGLRRARAPKKTASGRPERNRVMRVAISGCRSTNSSTAASVSGGEASRSRLWPVIRTERSSAFIGTWRMKAFHRGSALRIVRIHPSSRSTAWPIGWIFFKAGPDCSALNHNL